MKQLIANIIFLSLLLCSFQLNAQEFEKSKSFSETYFLNDQMEVSIQNKYGDIQIINWDIDSVKIEVNVKVSSNKQSKVDKIFNLIKMDYRHNYYYVIAKTEFVGQNGFWTDVSDISKTIFNSNTSTKVEYIVHIPNTTKLTIKNKYGNIYLGDYSGELNVDLSNGDLRAHHLIGKSNLKMSFGDLLVGKLKWAHLQFSYVEAHIEECGYMETFTSTSKLYITDIDELNIESGHDKYHIENVNKIYGKSKFSYIKITNLDSNISLSQRYGALHFKSLNNAIEYFSLETYKTEIHLGLDNDKAYLLDFRCIKKPHVQYTTGEFTMTEEVIDEETKLKRIKVVWGDSESKQLIHLNINAEEGNVFLDVK